MFSIVALIIGSEDDKISHRIVTLVVAYGPLPYSKSHLSSPLINNKFNFFSEKLMGIQKAKMNHSYFLASNKIYITYTSMWVVSVNLGKPFGTLPPNILRVEIVFWKKMFSFPWVYLTSWSVNMLFLLLVQSISKIRQVSRYFDLKLNLEPTK